MNINSKNFDKIEAYLFNQLEAEEKKAFEAEIATNPSLKKEVKLQQAEHRAMQLMMRKKLKAKMAEWPIKITAPAEAKETGKIVALNTSRSRRSNLFRWSIAASILLVVGLFSNLWMDNNLSDAAIAEDLFNSTYVARNGSSTASEVLAPGLAAMEANNFTKAVELFSQIKAGNYRETALVLKGESYFKLEEYQNAADVFKEVIQNRVTPLNVEKAEWKLLLTQLMIGDDAEIADLKNKILKNPEHSYYPRVIELEEKQANFLKKMLNK